MKSASRQLDVRRQNRGCAGPGAASLGEPANDNAGYGATFYSDLASVDSLAAAPAEAFTSRVCGYESIDYILETDGKRLIVDRLAGCCCTPGNLA